MTIEVTNAQADVPVSTGRLARLARCAIRRLSIRAPGVLAITLLDPLRMRRLNRRFLAHDRPTDVLSFRYNGARQGPSGHRSRDIVGDILIAPALARDYAGAHGLVYSEEVARYVLHGILHWLGYEDRTPVQQRAMRRKEDWLLARCGAESTRLASRDRSIFPAVKGRDRSIFSRAHPREKMDQSRSS